MDISEIGMSKQIRILYEDSEWLEKQKLVPEEPWYKVFGRLRVEYEAMKKDLKIYKEITKKRDNIETKTHENKQPDEKSSEN